MHSIGKNAKSKVSGRRNGELILWSGICRPFNVRCPSTFSNNFSSEASGPIGKFHVQPPDTGKNLKGVQSVDQADYHGKKQHLKLFFRIKKPES